MAVVGLNPGTAIYAQYLAKDGHEVTVLTEGQGDVVIMDLLPHASLNIVGGESTKLFTRRYLEDVLGIEILNVKLNSVLINGDRVSLIGGGGERVVNRYDRVVVGSEALPRESSDCVSIYRLAPSSSNHVINGSDAGKNAESLMLIRDMGGNAVTNSPIALDNDVLKPLMINRNTAGIGKCVSTDYEVAKPLIGIVGKDGWFIGRGFAMRDSLSGIEYVINRDYQLIMMGKLMALRDLGIIDSLPPMPRLEIGFSRNWSFLTIGLTRDELGSVYRDLSSSRVSYHGGGVDIVAKVIYRGNRLLNLQVLARGVRPLNWFSTVYSLVMLNNTAYLLLDMGYEVIFGTVRGPLEQLMLNLYNI